MGGQYGAVAGLKPRQKAPHWRQYRCQAVSAKKIDFTTHYWRLCLSVLPIMGCVINRTVRRCIVVATYAFPTVARPHCQPRRLAAAVRDCASRAMNVTEVHGKIAGCTATEFLRHLIAAVPDKACAKEPARFTLNPLDEMPGLKSR